MKKILTNMYVQSVALFLVIVGGYGVYVNLTHVPEVATPMMPETTYTEMSTNSEEVSDTDPNADLKGIHIMSNGDVMLGNGEVVADAVINAEGMIEIPDGRVVAPVMDMR